MSERLRSAVHRMNAASFDDGQISAITEVIDASIENSRPTAIKPDSDAITIEASVDATKAECKIEILQADLKNLKTTVMLVGAALLLVVISAGH